MNLKHLGQRIRELREARGLKQRDVASALQISAQAVSKWERGENAPDISVLLDLSQLLDVTCDVLLGRKERLGDTFPAAVFVSELAGFARDAVDTSPRDVALRTNGVLHPVTEALLAFDGVPVKYTGDGLLGFFSGPTHAKRALDAALRARKVCDSPALTIAVHQGEIFLGKLGHPDYASLDILGDTVNTAFLLLQWAVAQHPGAVCASATLAAAAPLEVDAATRHAAELPGLAEALELVCLP
ncbi:MAG: helix-turn-helix domain-containing protein [Planctomycetes bacterium]|nr:helix-turn-helix domain-containing protein [Planctomycetota bacterium]